MSLINKEDLMLTLGITDMDCEKCGWYSRATEQCKRGSDFEDVCCAIENAPTIDPIRKVIDMRLNLNDNIKVKLTDLGKDIYYHQYDRTNAFFGREICKPSYPEVDEDGYTTFQLWCFIELYGVHMGMALPNVIEPLDIVFDSPTISPVRKGHKVNQHSYPAKWLCSECGAKHFDFSDKFCSECGANVEEGDLND